MFLCNKNGEYDKSPAYTSDLVTSSHGGNGTYVLSEKDGKDYLLHSLTYEQHGSAMYTYQAMCINEEGVMDIAESGAEAIEEYEESIGNAEWKRCLYWSSSRAFDLINWVEELSASDYSKLYLEYNGSKLQRIDNCNFSPTSCSISCGVPASCDVIYYRANASEDEQDVLYKMIEKMI